ncbi:hypothetical protein [Mycobacterium sp. 3519A]|uniref:hypothetical protein n=1 Tax=Mycobacterium sp. 3519A TaxID=2057184 RepID=UPI001159A741|nr:hypothetical protein [Mycobacterium sp. 3519A]
MSQKRNRIKYAAVLVGAVAAVALPSAGLTAVANAQKVWDIETYDYCMEQSRAHYQRGEITLQELTEAAKTCCEYNDGVWNAATQDCQAPPGDTAGTRQIPGTIRIPTDMAIAPGVTKPPRQIQVSDQPFTVR